MLKNEIFSKNLKKEYPEDEFIEPEANQTQIMSQGL